MRKGKKTFWRPAAAGFGAVYLLTMGLATYLVKEKFTDDYDRRLEEAASYIMSEVSEKEFAMEEEGWASEESRRNFYRSMTESCLWRIGSDKLQISVGFYDRKKHLLARTRNKAGGGHVVYVENRIEESPSFGLDEYLSGEEMEELAGYVWEEIRLASPDYPDKYRFSVRTSPEDRDELWEIYVQEITWTKKEDVDERQYEDPLSGGHYSMELQGMVDYETGEEIGESVEFYETDSKIVWQWTNPAVAKELLETGEIDSTFIGLPYLNVYVGSFKSWKRWNHSRYLQDYPEYGEFSWEGMTDAPSLLTDSDGFYYRGKYKLQVGMTGDPFSYMEIRMEGVPWLEAMAYMKYVYLAGLVLSLACMGKVVWVFRKTYEKQAALEETRRDFTNAMAHELKTPLGIIRNFAENLMEHNMEEKREYYLSRIIDQTEEMDRLVVKMIEVSKLDLGELILGEEPVSFAEVLEEETARLAPVMQEKQIQVEFQTGEDFQVKGDREYLGKAVWNLLCNGADYNVHGGRIRIKTDREQCIIENTGLPVEEETLVRGFELFYTGEKSRSKKDGHMGMGLYLAKKILKLHGLELALENTEDGVRAVIKRQHSIDKTVL